MQRRGLTYGLLIVVALAMGIVASGVPRMHHDAPLRLAATPGSTAATTTSAVRASSTTMTPAAPEPRTITVLVANASGVNGAAAKRATTLTAAGYHVLTPANTANAPTSDVFFARGAEADARAVAATLRIPAGDVHAMAAKPPPPNASAADVVVVIGRDLGAG